ncbi:MAG: protein phosphatase 2C domain-containing protein [Polyangiaceae bacterium]|nr:protein phosphatase 2C domain-containing protein [Polyangiaceae bacterium]
MKPGVLPSKQVFKITAAGKTDPGRVREINEDNLLLDPALNLFLVCDGMGGHATGNIASKLAVKSIHNYFEATEHGAPLDPPHADDGDASTDLRRLAGAIRKANRDVHEISTSHERHKGMGSTVVAIHIHDDTLSIAHTGDSRCYRLRDGELKQLTRDHSLHNEALALKPNLSPERLAKLPKNVVTRALGMKDHVQVELGRDTVLPGDLYLLCSDGLYNMVQDHDIVGILELQDSLQESCDLLVTMANDAGGTDNISVVLVQVEEAPPPSGPALHIVEERYEPPPTPPPPPASGPIQPAGTVFLRDEAQDEIDAIEEILARSNLARQDTLAQTHRHFGQCAACGFPRLDWNDFCVECGAPFLTHLAPSPLLPRPAHRRHVVRRLRPPRRALPLRA